MPDHSVRQPPPRCPKCRWFLRFAPNGVVYPCAGLPEDKELNIWAGYCWNPNCEFETVRSVGGFRVVGPREAIYA